MEIDLSNWMAKLPTTMQKVPIRQLSMPGSHDSGGFYLDKNSSIAPDEGKTVQNLAKIFGSCAKNIIYKWSLTQNLCTHSQLEQGVRYFDLRVAFDASTKSYCFVHGLYGVAYSTIFKEFKEFLSKHPKEVLILDFNHLWDFTKEQCKEFMQLIEDDLGGLLYGPQKKGADCSLQDVWGTNTSIIAFYEDAASAKGNKLFWDRSKICSPWYNTADVDELVEDLNKRFDTLKDGCFNVFQAILSPQTATIILHLAGSLKSVLGDKCALHVCSWLQAVEKERKNGVNIVICDFIEMLDLPSKIIALNYLEGKERNCDCSYDQEFHFETEDMNLFKK